MRKTGKRIHNLIIQAVILLLAFLMLYPIIFMVFTSLKSNPEFFRNFWGPPTEPILHNYKIAWDALKDSFGNTVVICLISVPGVVITGSLSAYAFARLHFPFKNLLYYLVLALMMIPNMLVLIPSYILVARMGIMNTYLAVSLPAIANGEAFVIFIMRGFFANLPEEIFESARIDGAAEWKIYLKIAVPLSLPIVGTVAIMRLLNDWNDYLWPSLTLKNPEKWTIAIAVKAFKASFDLLPQWGPLYAGFALTVIPLVLFFSVTMKYYIEGISAGAVKG